MDNIVEAFFLEANVELVFNNCPDIVKPVIDIVKRICFKNSNIIPSGSTFEGTAVDPTADVDMMLKLPMGSVKLHSVGLPGFTLIEIKGPKRKLWQKFGCADRGGLLNATIMRDLLANCVEVAVSKLQRNVVVKPHGPAVTLKIRTPDGRNVAVDLTLAIKVDWPGDAMEWITRPRVWPDDDLLQEIVLQDGCHVVAKEPSSTCSFPNDVKAFCWRFSFSAAERRLFIWGGLGDGSQSCVRQVFCMLKALKPNLKPLNSYHFKTIWFHLREIEPHSSWSPDQCWERLKDLLSLLEVFLEFQFCPHFFMKTVNLFQEFDPIKCSVLVNKVRNIRMRINTQLAVSMGKMKQVLHKKKKLCEGNFRGHDLDESLQQRICKKLHKKCKTKKRCGTKTRKNQF